MTQAQELIKNYSNEVRNVNINDKIYKDECVYSFDNPESEHGLFVCLKTLVAVGRDHLTLHFDKTQSHLYLNIKTHRREKKTQEEDLKGEPDKKKPIKFGIGIEGGFDMNENQFYFETEYALYVYPEDILIKLPENDYLLDDRLKNIIETIEKAESATYKEELESQMQAMDFEQRFISKHASNLYQVPNPPQIPPSGWKCELCDKRDNLWLNLSNGLILCGRKQLDGSGGNNHAIEHYQKTKYPLAVKLGTITSQGKADIFSYDEDDMVEDPNLAVHLAHFGININKLQKTEKTMAELEIDLNQKIGEWDVIQESGCELTPRYGAGFTGLRNLGNSCYMNSVMQMLFSIDSFINKYYASCENYFKQGPIEPSSDFKVQMAKLAYGLLSGCYSNEKKQGPKGIKPQSFKNLIGRGHVEFSTKRQQDAQEFLAFLITLIDRNCRNEPNPADVFKFSLEDRIQDLQSNFVKYKKRVDNFISLPVAKEAITNKQEYDCFLARKQEAEKNGTKLDPNDLVRPIIPLMDCFRLFAKNELISDFYSSQTRQKGEALKSTKFSSFPEYLLIQIRKFELSSDWTPIKLDVAIDAPNILDLNEFKSSGLTESEHELPDDDQLAQVTQQTQEIRLNDTIVQSLLDMGFTFDGARRAAYNTRELNDVEAAVNWAVSHMEDADFNAPFELPKPVNVSTGTAKNEPQINEEALESIMSWGFTRPQAIKALKETNGNLERAADWIFSHTDEIMNLTEESAPQQQHHQTVAETNKYGNETNSKYRLVSFVSHMGSNANVGHYVVHILKDDNGHLAKDSNGKWYIFNDQNVAYSEKPHKELAYLYLYQRID